MFSPGEPLRKAVVRSWLYISAIFTGISSKLSLSEHFVEEIAVLGLVGVCLKCDFSLGFTGRNAK